MIITRVIKIILNLLLQISIIISIRSISPFFIFVFAEIALRAIGFQTDQEPSEEERLVQEFDDAIVMCRVEKISDVLYFYNAQDENFVGQARNIDEMNNISERLQKHLMVVDGQDE